MRYASILLTVGLAAFLTACQKHGVHSNLSPDIIAAKTYFESTIIPNTGSAVGTNPRSKFPKSPQWEAASELAIPNGNRIIVPLHYAADVYLARGSNPQYCFNLNEVSFLVMDVDPSAGYRYSVATLIPDVDSGVVRNSGLVLVEDWAGASQQTPIHYSATGNPASGTKESTVLQSIQICDDIYGYNYSVDDPGEVEPWVETSCTTYSIQNPVPGGAVGGSGGTRLLPPIRFVSTVVLPPPGNPIANIADYLKCFAQGDAGNSFSVTLAVEQPNPGTRQPWTFTSGGVPGSIAQGNPVNVGHTWLIFSENESGGQTVQRNVGFYPASAVTPGNAQAQGALGDDEATAYNISLTITVTSAQFFQMLQYVSQGNAAGYDYNLSSNNCTTFAVDALSDAGIAIPSTVGSWPNGQGLDPGDLGEDIRAMNTAADMTKNTVSNYHPNTGICN